MEFKHGSKMWTVYEYMYTAHAVVWNSNTGAKCGLFMNTCILHMQYYARYFDKCRVHRGPSSKCLLQTDVPKPQTISQSQYSRYSMRGFSDYMSLNNDRIINQKSIFCTQDILNENISCTDKRLNAIMKAKQVAYE